MFGDEVDEDSVLREGFECFLHCSEDLAKDGRGERHEMYGNDKEEEDGRRDIREVRCEVG